MGLDIFSDDEKMNYYSGYITFAHIRGLFAAHYDTSLYREYVLMNPIPLDNVGDLAIILEHSDVDGELTSQECQKLLPCLLIDEELVQSIVNTDKADWFIEKMYEFRNIVQYCAENPQVKLIFG